MLFEATPAQLIDNQMEVLFQAAKGLSIYFLCNQTVVRLWDVNRSEVPFRAISTRFRGNWTMAFISAVTHHRRRCLTTADAYCLKSTALQGSYELLLRLNPLLEPGCRRADHFDTVRVASTYAREM